MASQCRCTSSNPLRTWLGQKGELLFAWAETSIFFCPGTLDFSVPGFLLGIFFPELLDLGYVLLSWLPRFSGLQILNYSSALLVPQLTHGRLWDFLASITMWVNYYTNLISSLCVVLVVVQWLNHVRLFVTPWTAARQAALSFTISQILLKLMSIKSVMPSNQLILCCPLLLLPPILPSIRVFSNESTLHMRWPKY